MVLTPDMKLKNVTLDTIMKHRHQIIIAYTDRITSLKSEREQTNHIRYFLRPNFHPLAPYLLGVLGILLLLIRHCADNNPG
jgi:hypothetical protein